MTTLKDAQLNKLYKIKKVAGGDTKVIRRFLELGMLSGQVVKVINKSILKKVYLVEIRGYLLSIKISLLDFIEVEEK